MSGASNTPPARTHEVPANVPGLEPIDFHAAEIRSGRGFWRGIEKEKREAIVQDVTTAIANANQPGVVLFAAVIERNERLYGKEAVKHATEEVRRRFDIRLTRRYKEHDDPQRGLIVFAESSYEKRADLGTEASGRGSRHHRSRLRRRAAKPVGERPWAARVTPGAEATARPLSVTAARAAPGRRTVPLALGGTVTDTVSFPPASDQPDAASP